ncbi:MAG: lipocalin-like domain-containing protein [Anaerolineales bacterium]|nr:lipocalin-like domain-containing protein [Anaerolineales bacterium]
MEAKIKPALIGAWNLLRFEFNSTDGRISHPFGAEAVGSIIYTDTLRFSGQLMRTDRPRFKIPDQLRGTPEEVFANYQGVISYFGAYQLDEAKGVITHLVEGSLFPNMEGTRQIRHYELNENILTLRTPPFNANGERVRGLMTWERVK